MWLLNLNNLSWPLVAILNVGSIFKKSLAHPNVARNVMLKLKKKLPKQVFAPTKKMKLICGGHFEFQKTLKNSPAHLHMVGNVKKIE